MTGLYVSVTDLDGADHDSGWDGRLRFALLYRSAPTCCSLMMTRRTPLAIVRVQDS